MLCRPAVIAHAFALGSLGFQINHALQGVGYWGGFEAFSLCNGSLTAAGYSGNSRKTGCGAELFLKNPKKYFEGFLSGASRISRVWGRHSPTRFPQGQNERKANFGTAVESCSKKVAAFSVLSVLCFSQTHKRKIRQLARQSFFTTTTAAVGCLSKEDLDF